MYVVHQLGLDSCRILVTLKMILFLVSLVSLLAVISAHLWNRKQKKFFRDNKIHYVPSSSLFGGSLKDVLLLRKPVAQVMLELYEEASRRSLPLIGAVFMNKNCVILRDLDLIKRVLVQDFNHFSNRSATADFHSDPFGGYNLFLLKNPAWHDMRAKITPLFTTSRMRMFFDDVNSSGDKLQQQLLKDIPSDKVVSLKQINGAFCIDVFASCSFGIEVNFIENPESLFGQTAMGMFDFTLIRALEFGSSFVLPEISKILPTFFFSKGASAYLRKMLSAVMAERMSKGATYTRNDLMEVLLKIKSSQESDTTEAYSDDMLMAQSVIFFVAGFETTSTAMTHSLYEIARNVREEYRGHGYIQEVS